MSAKATQKRRHLKQTATVHFKGFNELSPESYQPREGIHGIAHDGGERDAGTRAPEALGSTPWRLTEPERRSLYASSCRVRHVNFKISSSACPQAPLRGQESKMRQSASAQAMSSTAQSANDGALWSMVHQVVRGRRLQLQRCHHCDDHRPQIRYVLVVDRDPCATTSAACSTSAA